MATVVWVTQAIEDINSIAEYIAQDSIKYAAITVEKLFQRASILENHPKAGRIVPETNQENIRELIEGNYRIIYQIISEKRVEILTVHHSARQLTNL